MGKLLAGTRDFCLARLSVAWRFTCHSCWWQPDRTLGSRRCIAGYYLRCPLGGRRFDIWIEYALFGCCLRTEYSFGYLCRLWNFVSGSVCRERLITWRWLDAPYWCLHYFGGNCHYRLCKSQQLVLYRHTRQVVAETFVRQVGNVWQTVYIVLDVVTQHLCISLVQHLWQILRLCVTVTH